MESTAPLESVWPRWEIHSPRLRHDDRAVRRVAASLRANGGVGKVIIDRTHGTVVIEHDGALVTRVRIRRALREELGIASAPPAGPLPDMVMRWAPVVLPSMAGALLALA